MKLFILIITILLKSLCQDPPDPHLDAFISLIPKTTPMENFNNFRFRSIFHYINDVQFTSLNEIPCDLFTKRQIEDALIFPRKNEEQKGMQINRLLFFGYSKEIIEDTAKAISVENKWLFYEIDSS